MKVTRIAILLDDSVSMFAVRQPASQAFNKIVKIVEQIRLNAVAGEVTTVSLWTFGRRIRQLHNNIDASKLTKIQYNPCQDVTKLNDAIVEATRGLHESSDLMNSEEANLVIIVTDGYDNASQHGNRQVRNLIEGRQKTGVWTYVMQVPPGQSDLVSSRYGIPIGNVHEWEATDHGTYVMGETTSSGLNTYYNARRQGTRSVNTFFADLSQVSEEEVKAMPDLSSHFKSYQVTKGEVEIRDFVIEKTGEYLVGAAYYQLTKPELVRKDRSILVRKRGEKKVYGGKDGRKLLGLPEGQDARLKVANLSDYEVFVESRSHNRKLVRGTVVLHDFNKQTSSTPTWTPVEPIVPALQTPAPKKVTTKKQKATPAHRVYTLKTGQVVFRDSRGKFSRKSTA